MAVSPINLRGMVPTPKRYVTIGAGFHCCPVR
jgi:hypothetical protein